MDEPRQREINNQVRPTQQQQQQHDREPAAVDCRVKRSKLICLRDLSNYRNKVTCSDVTSKSPTAADDIREPETDDRRAESRSPPILSKMASSSSLCTSRCSTPKFDAPSNRKSISDDMSQSRSPSNNETGSGSSNCSAPSPGAGRETGENSDGVTAVGCESIEQRKQLGKLKRFLATLQQLGTDISADMGLLVHRLVLALVANAISIEEFHDKLQKATNFPLRPFVIPFLRATLPRLQAELQLDTSRVSSLSPGFCSSNKRDRSSSVHSFISQQQQQRADNNSSTSPAAVSSSKTTSRDPVSGVLNENAKRPRAESSYDDSDQLLSPDDVTSPTLRRPAVKRLRLSGSSLDRDAAQPAAIFPHPLTLYGLQGLMLPGGADLLHGYNERSASRRLQDRERLLLAETERLVTGHSNRHVTVDDSDWKEVDQLLRCIVGLVERCQRALAALHDRHHTQQTDIKPRLHMATGTRLGAERSARSLSTSRITQGTSDDQRLNMIRLAEDAVSDVRRQALTELQLAVAAAEQKANRMLAAERANMDRLVDEVRQKTQQEVAALLNKQQDSVESCWNCGRVACETCSGCHEARYCGTFCQHRHWEVHHLTCSSTSSSSNNNSNSSNAGGREGSTSQGRKTSLSSMATTRTQLEATTPTTTTTTLQGQHSRRQSGCCDDVINVVQPVNRQTNCTALDTVVSVCASPRITVKQEA